MRIPEGASSSLYACAAISSLSLSSACPGCTDPLLTSRRTAGALTPAPCDLENREPKVSCSAWTAAESLATPAPASSPQPSPNRKSSTVNFTWRGSGITVYQRAYNGDRACPLAPPTASAMFIPTTRKEQVRVLSIIRNADSNTLRLLRGAAIVQRPGSVPNEELGNYFANIKLVGTRIDRWEWRRAEDLRKELAAVPLGFLVVLDEALKIQQTHYPAIHVQVSCGIEIRERHKPKPCHRIPCPTQ